MSWFTRYWGKFSYLLETRLCKRFDKYHVCILAPPIQNRKFGTANNLAQVYLAKYSELGYFCQQLIGMSLSVFFVCGPYRRRVLSKFWLVPYCPGAKLFGARVAQVVASQQAGFSQYKRFVWTFLVLKGESEAKLVPNCHFCIGGVKLSGAKTAGAKSS